MPSRPTRDAHDRADTIAAYLRRHGRDADAEVGDRDPLLAAVDAIALHPVDGVLILAADGRSGPRAPKRASRSPREPSRAAGGVRSALAA